MMNKVIYLLKHGKTIIMNKVIYLLKHGKNNYNFFFLYGSFFSRKTKLQSRGLTEKLSQIHGNSRNLHHKYFNLIEFKRNKRYKLIQNTQYINKGRKLDAKFNSRNEGYPLYI